MLRWTWRRYKWRLLWWAAGAADQWADGGAAAAAAAGNGMIDFREFLLLVHNYERPLPEDVEVREMFNALDKDKNGYVDRDELKTSFASLGITLSDGDVAEMMAEAEVYADRIYFEGCYYASPCKQRAISYSMSARLSNAHIVS